MEHIVHSFWYPPNEMYPVGHSLHGVPAILYWPSGHESLQNAPEQRTQYLAPMVVVENPCGHDLHCPVKSLYSFLEHFRHVVVVDDSHPAGHNLQFSNTWLASVVS